MDLVREDVCRMLEHLGLVEGVWEVRALDAYRVLPPRNGVFDDTQKCLDACADLNGRMNLYVGLNPRHAEGPVENCIVPRERMVRDGDVRLAKNLVLDLDAVRPKRVPASEDELHVVLERSERVIQGLKALGFPKPLVLCTGNGVQVFIQLNAVSIENEADRERVRRAGRVLEAWCRERFQDGCVRVDAIHNLSRLVRLAGSLNVKGSRVGARVWRVARIVSSPEERQEVCVEDVLVAFREYEGVLGSQPAEIPRVVEGSSELGSEGGRCCVAVARLVKEGYALDRSAAIWGLALVLAFEGGPEERAIRFLLEYDARTTRKLVGRRDAERYVRHAYKKAVGSGGLVSCSWLRHVGYCPGVARCDWGRHELALPNAGEEVSRGFLEERMWKPKEVIENLGIRPGDYEAQVVDAVDGVSKSSGAEMTTVAFDVEAPTKCRVWEHFVKGHPVAERRMMQLLAALKMLDQKKVEAKDLVGKRLKVRVGVERFQGLPQVRVKAFLALDKE